jgi:hypothetical protein
MGKGAGERELATFNLEPHTVAAILASSVNSNVKHMIETHHYVM